MNYLIFSQAPAEAALFYAKVFCSDKPEPDDYDGIPFYRCKLPSNCQLSFFKSRTNCKQITLTITVAEPFLIYERLIEKRAVIECYDKQKGLIIAEDIDGNKLHIIRRKLEGCGMPILG